MCAKIQKEHSKKTLPGESDLSKRTPSHESGIVSADPGRASYMTYQEQIKSPKWQKKRLEILERDRFACRICNDSETELHVHHKAYIKSLNVWEYPNHYLITLCDKCHKLFHKKEVKPVVDNNDFENINDEAPF